jgi:O-antigen/teichoic acid export membrane protein
MFKAILRLTKQSAIYGIGHVLAKAVVIFLLPIHTNFVSRSEFGIATLLLLFLGIMGIVYSYGLNTALLQFYLLDSDQKKRKSYFSTAFLATLITAAVFSLGLFLLKRFIVQFLFDSDQYIYLIHLSIGILSFDALVLIAKNILRAEEKSISYVAISFLNMVMNLLFNILFVAKYSMGVKGIFWANLISSAICFIFLLPIILKNLLPEISWSIFNRMFKFGLPFLPSTLAIFFIDFIDRYFIKHYLGLEATGVYGAGYRLALVIKLFINAFQIAWIPFFISMANKADAKEVYSKVLTYFTLICSLIFLSFNMYMDEIIRFSIFGYTIFGKDYWEGTQIVPGVILAYICYGFYLNFLVGIYLKEKTKYLAIVTVAGALVNILGNFFLIPSFKLIGAAYSTLLSYSFTAVSLYLISQKYYSISYEFGKIFKVALLTSFVFLIFKYGSLPYESIAKFLLLIAYFIALYFLRFFDSREIEKIKQVFKGFYGKVSTR